MKQFISFVIKETKHILRDKRTMLILFGMPVVMMLLFGFAITNIIAKTICAIFQNQMCKNRDFLHIFLASFLADFGRILNAV